GTPDERVGGGHDRDLADAGAVRCEVERREAPGERVVEVVDQSRLATGAQDRISHARLSEGFAKTWMRGRTASMRVLFEGDVGTRIAHRKRADQEADRGDQRRADPDDGPRRVARGERAADEGRDRKSTRLNSSHVAISYAVFCLKKKSADWNLAPLEMVRHLS